MSKIDLMQGDCLELMKNIPDGSVDMILCDLPYGITNCGWDTIIDFNKLWTEYKRIATPIFNVLLFCSGVFILPTIQSNIEWYKYPLIWIKSRKGNFVHAKNRPMTGFEQICVFSPNTINHASLARDKRMKYNPQGLIDCKKVHNHALKKFGNISGTRPSLKDSFISTQTGYPCDVLQFNSPSDFIHPTQKTIELLEYLIRTYSNEGDTVLDNCMGSGSTGVACVHTNRNFIGIEKEPTYFRMARDRIECHQQEQKKIRVEQLAL